MKYLSIIIIAFLFVGCGSKYVKVESQRFNVKVKQLYKQNGVIVIYYLKDQFNGAKVTSKDNQIKISVEPSLYEPVLIITEKSSVDELRGTKDVLSTKYNLVLPKDYVIKIKE